MILLHSSIPAPAPLQYSGTTCHANANADANASVTLLTSKFTSTVCKGMQGLKANSTHGRPRAEIPP